MIYGGEFAYNFTDVALRIDGEVKFAKLRVGLAFAITNYFYGEKSVYDCVKRSAIYGRV